MKKVCFILVFSFIITSFFQQQLLLAAKVKFIGTQEAVGKVRKIDIENDSISISYPLGEDKVIVKNFTIDENTQFIGTTLYDIKEGDWISVIYTVDENGNITVNSISLSSPERINPPEEYND